MNSRELLAQLVRFDTTSRESNLALIDFVRTYLQDHGVACALVYNEHKSKANLLATIGPAEVPGIVLSGHTDVVPVEGQRWSVAPFDLTEKDGKLYGRGTADMKGYIACVLACVPALVRLRCACRCTLRCRMTKKSVAWVCVR
jgi:acetylornithine deacetylase